MKVIAKKNRELALINAQNTQNENRAEIITLVVPEEYEDYNKKIVFILPNNTRVSDIITNNEYQITNAITQYEEVEFYIWLTKGNVDFRTKTKPLKFYHNENASNDITPEQIGLVNTVVNLLEEEIDKVENLDLDVEKIGTVATLTLTKKDGTTKEVEITDGQDGYTPQKGTDYFTQEDIEEIENGVKTDLEETVLVDYSLITETGSKIDLSINTTNYKLTAILKDKNNNIICTSNEIDLPLETMVVSASYDNTTKEIILILQNGTTVEFSVADLVSGLVSETQLQTILANYYTQTEINNLLANKVDKVAGKGLSTNDFTDEYKEKVDTNTEDIEDIQEEQTEQNTEIENLQTENERLRNTLPTTTVTGQTITLNKTAELEFKKPPLPMGNSEQVQYSGKNKFKNLANTITRNSLTMINDGKTISIKGTNSSNNFYPSFIFYADGSIVTDEWWPTLVKINTTKGYFTESEKTYMFSLLKNGTYNGEKVVYFIGKETKIAQYNIDTATTYTNLIASNSEKINFVAIGFYPNQQVDLTFEIQIEEGSTSTKYEPYVGGTASPNPDYPQEITNVTGDVEVVVENKNLFRLTAEDFQNGENLGAGKKVVLTLKPNTSYTLSSNEAEGSSTETNIWFNGTSSSENGVGINRPKTAQTNSNGELYISIRGNKVNSIFQNYWIQLEEGTTTTSYVANKDQTFTFPLGNEKLMLGDYLADDGIHHVRGQDIFDGSEDEVWAIARATLEKTIQFRLSGSIYNTNVNDVSFLCNSFIHKKWIESYYPQKDEEYLSQITSTDIVISINRSRLLSEDVAGFKNWLSSNPVIIEHIREEEQIVPYTSAQQTAYNQIKQALSYEGQTNISSNQNAIFNVEAYQSTKLILESIDSRLTLVEG